MSLNLEEICLKYDSFEILSKEIYLELKIGHKYNYNKKEHSKELTKQIKKTVKEFENYKLIKLTREEFKDHSVIGLKFSLDKTLNEIRILKD